MSVVQVGELNSDSGRVAVLNDGTGAKIIASNQCGDFPFKLTKMIDPRVDIDSVADYDKNVVAYVGARNWNKFRFNKDYTNPSQLKFSNIKTPGAGYLIDMKWWLEYTIKIKFKGCPCPNQDHDTPNVLWGAKDNVFLKDDMMYFRPFPLHQCTDNIHLRLNNRDMISYPTQTLNQRMEYWQQDKFRESSNFAPHRKSNVQDTNCYLSGKDKGRWPMLDLGSSYDGDFGNETAIVDGHIKFGDRTVEEIKLPKDGDIDAGEKEKAFKLSKVSQEITLTLREPVMCEPLDYYSSRTGNKTMNNVTSIDLEYNFNNLRNMIIFNRAKMCELSAANALNTNYTAFGIDLKKTSTDYLNLIIEKNLESIFDIEITEAHLELDIATPQVPPSMPFVTEYVEYRRYETAMSTNIDISKSLNDKSQGYVIDSEIYSLSYMPNSIYLWVAPNNTYIYGQNTRCFYNNSYAQITHLEVDYGNLTKLGHHYSEKDLFLMALRNGLEDRTYVDWTRTKRNAFVQADKYVKPTNKDQAEAIAKNEFFGVGSVLRVIPGIDLCSGGEQTLIGGMKITNETIRFHVTFRPLNLFDDGIKYSLYVAFEYNGICTVTPGFCDLAMIHIDSYNQIANAERAPRYKISRIYGKGFWDKVKKFASGVNNFAKKTGIVSKVLSAIPQTQMIAPAIANMGYGYRGASRATRMRGGMVIPPGSFYRTY